MPFVNIRIARDGNGATAEQKAAVIRGVTDVLVKVLDKNPERTHVVIEEVDPDNWGFAGDSVTVVRQRAAAQAAAASGTGPAKRG
jgi:4-oxalocrotonate tautomerase